MLTGLRLGNFKAFADTQYIPIRPLTLIFGANSAGKSSVIHSLLLACHASETGELDIHRTRVGGESVDLGGFRQYIHRRNYGRSVEYSTEIDISPLRGRIVEILAPARRVAVTVTIGIEQDDMGVPKVGVIPQVQTYEILVDGASLLRMSHRPDGTLQLDRLAQDHPVLRILIKAILETTTTAENIGPADQEGINRAISELVPHILTRVDGLLPRGLLRFGVREYAGQGQIEIKQFLQRELFEKSPLDLPTASEESMLFPISQGRREEDLANAIRFFLPRTIDELIRGLRDVIGNELGRLQYLGPLRSYPPRHIAFAQHHDQNWFAGGGYAWDVVRKNRQVRAAVNAWLNSPERLQTPYLLAIRELVGAEDLQTPLTDMLQQAAELVSEEGVIPIFDDPESAATAFVKKVSSGEIDKINELILMDNRTRTQVSHRDVGIGISQVLPVLVTAYASRNKILAMEQPEIHLHPALQAELGDVFIESALGERKNTMILETHSEHLMLRILRRIRETTENELPSNAIPIKPDDVAVLFIDATSSGSRVIEIPILPEGEFAKQWPHGFFDDRAKELF
ncbi:MAG: DUF3696 domain-containing protein [Nitrospira sp.]|nr:DUF3696 domain-containing protein [Nitrospira sp.]